MPMRSPMKSLVVLCVLPLATSRAVLGHGARACLLPTPPHARTPLPVRCVLDTDAAIKQNADRLWVVATDGKSVIDKVGLRKVLDAYGIAAGSDAILNAYDDDTSGDLAYDEFIQLVTVLEAAKARDEAASPTTASPSGGSSEVAGRVGEAAYNTVSSWAKVLVDVDSDQRRKEEERGVSVALRRMQRDMSMLDQAAGSTPQLSNVELAILTTTVSLSFFSPFGFSEKVVEVLVPSMSALAAAIGFSAEYAGKVAVSKGKEVAAITLQAAAEAELYLAQAERTKAIIPLCVGLSATAAAFALLVPAIAVEMASKGVSMQIMTELYLVCPLVSVLAAAVAALSAQESTGLANRAMSVGARRFASSTDVGRTWLSATEQVTASTSKTKQKWSSFSVGVLPAPIFAILCPGPLSFKAIVAAAVGAAQCAYSLASAEYTLSAAVESVALKSRTAAVSDTYANQGARAGAILPFTSALSGLCAATTVAVVEVLPLISAPIGQVRLLPCRTISCLPTPVRALSRLVTPSNAFPCLPTPSRAFPHLLTIAPSHSPQSLVCVTFPAVGALIAAAASISKARCEVDAEAATAAATQLAETDAGVRERNPIRATAELVRLTVRGVVSDGRRRLTPKELLRNLLNGFRRLLRMPLLPRDQRQQRRLVV